MAENQVVAIRGYTTSWPCNVLMIGLIVLWTHFGFSVFYEEWGLAGFMIFSLASVSLYWMPAVVIVQPIEEPEDSSDDEDDEDDLVSDE